MAGITIVALFARRNDLTHDAFVERYEQGHVPLIRALLPPFGRYRRAYVSDPAARERLGYDVMTEAWFADTEAHEAVLRAMADPAIADAIAHDEDRFIDRARSTVFLADAHE
jgi:hypothetical protein